MYWNRVTPTPGAKYLVVDVKKVYRNNTIKKHEYYRIFLSLIPQEVIGEYDLIYNQINGFICVRVEKGMYGIFQAGIILHTALKEHLRPFGYVTAPSLRDCGTTTRMEPPLT